MAAANSANMIDYMKKLHAQVKLNKQRQLSSASEQLVETVMSNKLDSLVRRILDELLLPAAKRTYASSLLATHSLQARRELATLRGQKLAILNEVRNIFKFKF